MSTPAASSRVVPRPGDPAITPALVADHGITPFEYERLVGMLGRTPTFTEIGVVSALWSMPRKAGLFLDHRRRGGGGCRCKMRAHEKGLGAVPANGFGVGFCRQGTRRGFGWGDEYR